MGALKILHGVVAGLDHGAVFFQHADVGNLDALVGGVVAQLQLSPLLHAGFALHADAGDEFFAAGAVGLEAVAGVHLLDDEGLLGIVRSPALARSAVLSAVLFSTLSAGGWPDCFWPLRLRSQAGLFGGEDCRVDCWELALTASTQRKENG